jgi:choline dehydrogenase-like flavoprotein
MKETFGKISFHANAKLIAKFKGKLNAHLGTIFTHQLQEFLSDGFLFMPTNFNRAYLAMASSTINSSVYRQLVEESDYVGMFTAQFRTNGKLIDVRITKNRFLLLSYLTRSDLKKIKHYLNISCDLLFKAGAEYIQLPIPGTSPIHSMQEAKVVINRVNRGRLSLSTVHLMSSLPIPVFGSKTVSTLDHKGRLNRYPRINVMDASILPTSIGESPQATIMAMVRMFCKDIFKVKT